MRAAGGVALVAFTGCHAIFGLENPVRQSDAAVEDSPTANDDAPPDARQSCMQRWLAGTPQFQPPVLFTEVNSAATDATPAGSELGVTWASNRGGPMSVGGYDIWFATRETVASAWTTPAVIGEISSTSADWRLTTTADTLTGFFESDRAGGEGAADVWTATRANTQALFPTPTQTGLAAVNDAGEQKDPAISADGLELFVTGSNGISVTARQSVTDAFDPTVVLSELIANGERDPTPTSNPRLLLFTSSRVATGGNGDLFYALRPGRGQPFTTPVEVPGVNSTSADADPWLAPDGCTLYFVSTRPGSAGIDVYVAQMSN